MKFPIALQLYSVRGELEKDFEGTLRQVKALGYEGVEFAGLYGHAPAEVKALCQEIGLVPVSAHVPFVDMMANPDIIADYAQIGCSAVVIPYLTEEYRPGQPKFAEVISGAKLLGEKERSGIAWLGTRPVGIYDCIVETEVPEIDALGLIKVVRGKGLGRELLRSVMKLLAEEGYESCTLKVSTANEEAFSLYRSEGFTVKEKNSTWYEVSRRA